MNGVEWINDREGYFCDDYVHVASLTTGSFSGKARVYVQVEFMDGKTSWGEVTNIESTEGARRAGESMLKKLIMDKRQAA